MSSRPTNYGGVGWSLAHAQELIDFGGDGWSDLHISERLVGRATYPGIRGATVGQTPFDIMGVGSAETQVSGQEVVPWRGGYSPFKSVIRGFH